MRLGLFIVFVAILTVLGCASHQVQPSVDWRSQFDHEGFKLGGDLSHFHYFERKVRFSRRPILSQEIAIEIGSLFQEFGMIAAGKNGTFFSEIAASQQVFYRDDENPRPWIVGAWHPSSVLNQAWLTNWVVVSVYYNDDPLALASFLNLAEALVNVKNLPIGVLFLALPEPNEYLGASFKRGLKVSEPKRQVHFSRFELLNSHLEVDRSSLGPVQKHAPGQLAGIVHVDGRYMSRLATARLQYGIQQSANGDVTKQIQKFCSDHKLMCQQLQQADKRKLPGIDDMQYRFVYSAYPKEKLKTIDDLSGLPLFDAEATPRMLQAIWQGLKSYLNTF